MRQREVGRDSRWTAVRLLRIHLRREGQSKGGGERPVARRRSRTSKDVGGRQERQERGRRRRRWNEGRRKKRSVSDARKRSD